jgi:RHS repeat-associated protein
MLVSQTRTPGTSPATSFYGYSAHGNIRFLTDASGAETDSYDYDAWGNLVGRTGGRSNTRLYAGEECDPDLGLLNLRTRQYRSEAGRFLTLDSMAGSKRQPITLNRYIYGNDDPVGRIDPTGRMGVEDAIVLGGVAGILWEP